MRIAYRRSFCGFLGVVAVNIFSSVNKRDVVTTVSVRHTSNPKRLHFSAGWCPGAQGAWSNQLSPIILLTVEWFQRFLQNRLSSKYVVKSHHIKIALLHYTLWYIVNHNMYFWLWPPCVADADIIFLPSGFFFLSFFPRSISAIADWMFAKLAHMVWP